MTKIDIISGFLGAGKTTLIKKLLSDAFSGEKVVLIENEFGEIGIDGGFLKDSGIQITEMNSGCICCSLVGDFGKALQEVIDKYSPDRIIIEPSGVGKLSDVISAVTGIMEKIPTASLNSFSAVVDATKAKIYMKNFGEFFNNQVESAKTIVLSRTQKLSQEKLDEVVAMLKEHNDKAVIITTPWDKLDGKVVLGAMEQKSSLADELLAEQREHHHHDHDGECSCGHHHHDHDEDEHEHEHHHHDHDEDEHEHHHHDHDGECSCGHHHHDHDEDEHEHEHHHHDHDEDEHEHEHHHHDHDGECSCGHHHEGHHHADEVFTSWGVETSHVFNKDKIEEVLKKLADTEELGVILRAKGMIAGEDGHWIYFDLVPGEYELREGTPDYTGRLCVIGTKLDENKIAEAFGVN